MKKAYLYSRVSTQSQADNGKGIERQIEQAKQFLKNYPEYTIANDIFTDAASGYSGANLDENAGLGSFIRSAENSEIPKGSLLVLESPDRLSRLGIKKGQRIFDRIMACGIDIALVRFGIILKHDDDNDFTGSLIVSIGLYLGHLESNQKSERINFTLQKKKATASSGGEKYSGKAPAWLKLSKDKLKFNEVPEKANAVRLMFKLRGEGYSYGQIEAEMNKRNIPPFTGRAKRWYEASITKLLHYRQVLGECQFYKLKTISGKKTRVPDGKVIRGYYPQIVSNDLFYKVQATFREKKSGKISQYKNLFSGLTRCSCGAVRNYSKPNPKRDLVYLRCRNYICKPKLCDLKGLPYEPIEKILIQTFNVLDYSKLNDSYDDKALLSMQARVGKSQEDIDTLTNSITNFDNPDLLASLLPKLAAMQQNHNILLDVLSELHYQVPVATGTVKGLSVNTEDERTIYNNFISQHVNKIVTMTDKVIIHFKHRKPMTVYYDLKYEASNLVNIMKLTAGEDYIITEYQEINPKSIQATGSKRKDK